MAEYRDITSLKKQIADFKKSVNSPNSDYMTGYVSALSVTEGIIEGLPTADVVEVKHGEWIGKPIAGYSNIKCSACNEVFRSQTGKWKYCPNCGVKMDGRRDT